MRRAWYRRRWRWSAPDDERTEAPHSRRPGSQGWHARGVGLWVGLLVLTCLGTAAQAQERLREDPPGRPRTTPPALPEPPPPTPLPHQVLPPLLPPAPADPQQLSMPPVFVREIRITGSTVFSAPELATVTAKYVNQALTMEALETLRLDLTRLYLDRGYLTSGAIIPDQTVTAGVITLHIIEGTLQHIVVEGNRWFRTAYLRHRLALGAEPPVNIGRLQQRLQLLQLDPRIERLQAELQPGVQRGTSVLHVRVEERLPVAVALEVNNYQSPTVGAERGLLTVAHQNLTGHGDILSLTYGRSAGIDVQMDASYTLPLTARDTTLGLRYRRNDFVVIEEQFDPLDVESTSEVYSLTLRHPFWRTLTQEFALALTAERLHNATLLLSEPFSFSEGAEDGVSTVAAVRLAQEWTTRTQHQVLAVRSQFSVGVDALGATIHNAGVPDGQFFAWLGQVQWVRRLALWDTQVLVRLDVQLAADPLLPLEQIAVGGRFSVRGYRENELVRDNAVIASLEARLPLVRTRRWADVIEIAPFVDFGRGWNTDRKIPEPTTLVSLGLGLRWALTVPAPIPVWSQLEVYWGYPLKPVETAGGDLQDAGLHFQLVLTAF